MTSENTHATLRITGDVLRFRHDPFAQDGALELLGDHSLVIGQGKLLAVLPANEARQRWPDCEEQDYRGHWLLPGLIDAHGHYPQLAITASWGAELLPWLEQYTFPEESRFDRSDYARDMAARYQRLCLQNGITTPVVFCTSHPLSVEAWFEQAEALNMRSIAGQVLMDRNAPDALLRDHETALEEVQNQIGRRHGHGRQQVAITPRFAATSSREQLQGAGWLMARHDCLMQTHLSENPDEIRWMLSLFPECRDYLEIYEKHGLLGPRSLFAHGIHLSEDETRLLAESGAAIIHCPSSNLFLGSGLFAARKLVDAGIPLALGADVGAGPSLNPFSVMARAYEVSRLQSAPLNAAQLLWLATEGAAQTLKLDACIGRLQPGLEADLIALNPQATEALALRYNRAESIEEALFALLCLGDDRMVAATWLAGEQRWSPYSRV